jgi:hypothetical protein
LTALVAGVALTLGLLNDSLGLADRLGGLGDAGPDLTFSNIGGLQPGFELEPASFRRGVGYKEIGHELMLQISNHGDTSLFVDEAAVDWPEHDLRDGRVLGLAQRPAHAAQAYDTFGRLLQSRGDEPAQDRTRLEHRHGLPLAIPAGETVYAVFENRYELVLNGKRRLPIEDQAALGLFLSPIADLTWEAGDYACDRPLQEHTVRLRTDHGEVVDSISVMVLVAGCSILRSPEVMESINGALEGFRRQDRTETTD